MANRCLRLAGFCIALIVARAGYSQQVLTCPGQAANAFNACYYSNPTMSGNPALVRTDARINFDWGTQSPDPSLPAADFSVTWQGIFNFAPGQYTFAVTTSDGIRVYVDGTPVIDNWLNPPLPNYLANLSGNQTLAAGIHMVSVEYYHREAGATAELSWALSNPTPAPPNPAPGPQTIAAPSLVSAVAGSGNEIDLAWAVSSDATGIAGYEVLRNGSAIRSVPGNTFTYSDISASPGTTYTYTIVAFDAAGNQSAPSNSIQVSTPAAAVPQGSCPGPANNAFTGCYYPNTSLSGTPSFIRTDPQINFDWGNSSPDSSLPPSNFSVAWQGNFTFPQSTYYTFNIVTSDGMRIYIDGAKIFDQWVDQGANALNFSQPISAGTHLVTVQYFEQTGGATAQVSWQLTHAAPPPAPLPPVISSFSANPSTTTPGSPVTLSWNISGATSVTLSGVGDVTGSSSTTVNPSATTVYTLTASSAGGTTTASAIVNISSGPVSGGPGGGTQNPTVPTLVSAIAKSATEVDLTWTASSDPLGISSYQILRNGLPLDSVSGTTLSYADMTLSGGATASYSVRAYDAVGNNSAPSNTIQVTTPSAGGVSVTWYGPCWLNFTLNGITGNYQMIDYNITSPSPVAIQGTLFYNSNCSGSGDNLNDAYYLTNPGHGLKGFSHNVNVSPVSAVYWIGGPTQDGQCPAGSTSCSGCVVYNSSTLSCDLLP